MRPVRAVAPALFAAVVTLMLAGCASSSSSNPRRGARPPASPLVTPRPTDASNRAHTVRLVERLLGGVQLPGDAHRRTSAPVRELRTPATTPQSPDLADRRAWWTLPGPVSHALSYVRQHGVSGCRFGLTGSSSGGNAPAERYIGCDAPATAYAAQVGVLVQAVPTGRDTAIRIDARAIWIPARPAYSLVVHPSSVYVVVERDHEEPTVRRVLGRSDAERLAAVLNRFDVSTPGTYSCPAAFAGDEDALGFRTPNGRVRATVELSGCGGVTIRVSGHTSVDLAGSVDDTVRSLLHLPSSYGR